jgi:hypothetical protein
MQKAMRRAFGVGGATAVALAASLALAGVADAHTPTFNTGCLDNGQAQLTVNLQAYTPPKNNSEHNTITISYTPDGGKPSTLLPVTNFSSSYPTNAKNQYFTVDGTTAGTFTIVVTAWDDTDGSHSVATLGQNNPKDRPWDGTWIYKTSVCEQPPTKPTTTTTAPPTTTTASGPTSTGDTAPPTTTTAAAVAPVSDKTQTPPGGLAYTGVSTELPLIIAGVLIVLGAGALIMMRVMKRRRAES